MQIRYVTVVVALAGLCFGPIAATHVAAAQRPILNAIGNLPREYYVDVTYNDSYDARDFSGIWFRVGGDWSHGPPRTNPPLTPEGLALMQTHRPTRSYLPEVTEAVASYEETNYPAATCNPKGFPAIVVDINHDHHEVLVLPDRILQVWQEERMLREIWMDGRELPSGDNLANIGPSWMGMSVGKWEGNTLVVETIALDTRAWLDAYGFPKSDEVRFIERYTRTDEKTLELEMIMYDPKYYTAPWISDIKVWKKEARDARPVNNFGWHGLFSGLNDSLCAPINQFGGFGGD